MRILVVEDEDKVSRFVVKGLTAERFAVDTARDGKTGWELAQTYQYDLIILDLMLPGLTGGEVLNRIRKSKSQVPVLILTARDSVSDKVEHFEAGADDYLTKPFAFAELLVRVKALLRLRPSHQSKCAPNRGFGTGSPFATGETRRQTSRVDLERIWCP